jgi:transposase-like protein
METMTTAEKKCPECGSTRIRVTSGEGTETNTCRACDYVWTTQKTDGTPVKRGGDHLTP